MRESNLGSFQMAIRASLISRNIIRLAHSDSDCSNIAFLGQKPGYQNATLPLEQANVRFREFSGVSVNGSYRSLADFRRALDRAQ